MQFMHALKAVKVPLSQDRGTQWSRFVSMYCIHECMFLYIVRVHVSNCESVDARLILPTGTRLNRETTPRASNASQRPKRRK